MQKTYDFIKNCGVYYLATNDGGQPRVRPFGTIHIFEGKLYIQTGKSKDVSAQMRKDPRIEICAFKDGKWIRLSGKAFLDERIEAQQSLLDAYPGLSGRYKAGDGNNEVWYITEATSTISSFTEPPQIEAF